MESSQKRQTAYKVRISDLISGEYFKKEGWEPNYVLLKDGRKASRVNILGIVVSKDMEEGVSYRTVLIDDGSGKISIRSFEENPFFDSVEIGNVILVIGRPRVYGDEKYILPEILKKVDQDWLVLRKSELATAAPEVKTEVEKPVANVPSPVKEISEEESAEEEMLSSAEELINFIKKNDKGDGVDFNDLSKIKNGEQLIKRLLEEGDVFEIKPGKFKVLD